MTYAMKQALRRGIIAAALLVPGAALAQDAAAPAPAASDSPWVKMCGNDPQTKQQRCNISQVLLAKNGQVVASFSIQPMADNKVAVGAFVPLGFVIPAGVDLNVDGEKKAAAQFTICVPPTPDGPAGCAARADLDENFIASLKRGNKLEVILSNTQGQKIPIELTLSGFSKAYDGEGVDPVAARALEVEQSKQLQEDARAAFQRMIERQRQESGQN